MFFFSKSSTDVQLGWDLLFKDILFTLFYSSG